MNGSYEMLFVGVGAGAAESATLPRCAEGATVIRFCLGRVVLLFFGVVLWGCSRGAVLVNCRLEAGSGTIPSLIVHRGSATEVYFDDGVAVGMKMPAVVVVENIDNAAVRVFIGGGCVTLKSGERRVVQWQEMQLDAVRRRCLLLGGDGSGVDARVSVTIQLGERVDVTVPVTLKRSFP